MHPGVSEICDGVDNDCSGVVDDFATDALVFNQDADGDGLGYGNPLSNGWEELDHQWCGCMDNVGNPSFIDPFKTPNDCNDQMPTFGFPVEQNWVQCDCCIDYAGGFPYEFCWFSCWFMLL